MAGFIAREHFLLCYCNEHWRVFHVMCNLFGIFIYGTPIGVYVNGWTYCGCEEHSFGKEHNMEEESVVVKAYR